jgi:hypothetical protein
MKYEAPELTALTLAINAIQGHPKPGVGPIDTSFEQELTGAYQDYE